MEDLQGKVAVITGGASGIGRAVADRAAAAGMQIVLGDIEEGPLEQAVDDLTSSGAEAIGLVGDVSDRAAVEALRDAALDRFGAVHLVHNNAGIGLGGPIWEVTEEDWRWILGVNLWGVIHGVATFTPLLIEQGEGHIVNTASIAGLIVAPFLGPYNATKQAVVAISETLCKDLQTVGAPVGVSVLCPGFVQTRIAESDRNRPDWAPDRNVTGAAEVQGVVQNLVDGGIAPTAVADRVIDAVRSNTFYILTHPELDSARHDALRRHCAGAGAEPDDDRLRQGTSDGYSSCRTSAAAVRAAWRPGSTAAAFASAKAATAASNTDHTGTVGAGTAPICSANSVHNQRPRAIPSGMPTTTPTAAAIDAFQATVAPSWRCVNPSTLRSARSRRHRRTEATRASPRATRAASARAPASRAGVVPMER